MKTIGLASCFVIGLALSTAAHALDVDPQLPAYQPVPVGSAVIKSVGSDTMGDLMRNWANEFTKLNPDVKIEIDSRGSGTAPPALLEGASQIGAISRPMRSEEYEPLEKKYGYHPSSFPVAVDALAVYVNKDNPIECLTLKQLDDIFSKAYLHPGGTNLKTWGDAGLTGDWADAPIALFGRNSESGTHDTFVDAVLRHGEFRDELKEQPGLPSAELMGGIGVLALTANLASVLLLLRYKDGDANVRSVWLCSRNDAIGNVVVMGAALGVWATSTPWPDLGVAALMAGIFLSSSVQILRQAWAEYRHPSATAVAVA